MPAPTGSNHHRPTASAQTPYDWWDFSALICADETSETTEQDSYALEANFCRDFYCNSCDQVLEDLHQLLFHVEESHYEDLSRSDDNADDEETESEYDDEHTNGDDKDRSRSDNPVCDGSQVQTVDSSGGSTREVGYMHTAGESALSAKRKLQEPALSEPGEGKRRMLDTDILSRLLLSPIEKPYKCVGCEKTFKSSNGLKYHQRQGSCSDDADKPFACLMPLCPARFKSMNGVRYHIKHSHIHYLDALINTLTMEEIKQLLECLEGGGTG
ncbi:uncharacterized protein VTP21DRAFT_5600 [Calcarisporiella thermophila]|uniref:uncharacterized protein n=1 Tax=Calcarisporiella thermophila TaxID=911321 RepID=UPI0037430931